MTKRSLRAEFTKGILKENPVIGLMLGLCSVLAVSGEAWNAVGMGAAMTFVLLGSNLIVSLLRNSIPKEIRLPVYIVTIASFTTIADLVMNAYTPVVHAKLGIFIPLIVVNCIIIARAEAFASKNGVFVSIIDALGMGVGYTLALLFLAIIREALSAGTVFGIPFAENFEPILIMILPPGAYITIGLMMAGVRGLKRS